MQPAHLNTGDELNVEVHEGGRLTVTPIRRPVLRSDFFTKARTTKTLMRTACGLVKTFAAMIAPFSVKA